MADMVVALLCLVGAMAICGLVIASFAEIKSRRRKEKEKRDEYYRDMERKIDAIADDLQKIRISLK